MTNEETQHHLKTTHIQPIIDGLDASYHQLPSKESRSLFIDDLADWMNKIDYENDPEGFDGGPDVHPWFWQRWIAKLSMCWHLIWY